MNFNSKALLLVAVVLLFAAAHSNTQAAEFTVTVNSNSFSPSNRTIDQGDQITWVWGGSGSHTTTHVPTSGQPLWDEVISGSNQDFTRTFNTAGVFNYKCTPHGFTGKIIVNSTSGILDEPGAGGSLPEDVSLNQNSPNPFNAATQFEYSLSTDGIVRLTVFNILGQEVANLIDGFVPGGIHTALWDGRDRNGRDAPSGVYFARLVAADAVMTRKMVLLR